MHWVCTPQLKILSAAGFESGREKKEQIHWYKFTALKISSGSPIIQNEISEKEKDKYRILAHMYGI